MISIRGVTYDKVRDYCADKEFSIASFVDTLCVDFLTKKNEGTGDDEKEEKAGPLFDPEDLHKLRMR